ncbi:hypothetical protein FW774_00305 (plasmid) [Pedobacter sp. BS3]|uniref:hypothetical protein n=1 Tax=Pedobacter sp. BS3 TaxID=2567937 RepID=UPI0011ECC36D|nr:hypothetical protein [Pedobacter sp. BS3]TZF85560.1 hypothetical protein FW774_00305 [Pedobacter sp. BS3]
MKKILLIILVSCTMMFSCKKTKPVKETNEQTTLPFTIATFCDEKTIDTMQWVQDIKDGKTECQLYKGATLTMFSSDKGNIFCLGNNASSIGVCNDILYDCSGNKLGNLPGGKVDEIFYSTYSKVKIIWQKE